MSPATINAALAMVVVLIVSGVALIAIDHQAKAKLGRWLLRSARIQSEMRRYRRQLEESERRKPCLGVRVANREPSAFSDGSVVSP